MELLLGTSNNFWNYLLVLEVYGLIFILIRYPNPRVELNFNINFRILFIFWSVAMFMGNYVFYLLGVMSFLPWLNNFIHTFLWIGFCLTYLYSVVYRHNIIEQFFLFGIFSLIIKVAENLILGTWQKDPFYFFHGKYAYLIIMSVVDGFYPVISLIVLNICSRFIKGVNVRY